MGPTCYFILVRSFMINFELKNAILWSKWRFFVENLLICHPILQNRCVLMPTPHFFLEVVYYSTILQMNSKLYVLRRILIHINFSNAILTIAFLPQNNPTEIKAIFWGENNISPMPWYYFQSHFHNVKLRWIWFRKCSLNIIRVSLLLLYD